MEDLEQKITSSTLPTEPSGSWKDYLKGCLDPKNERLYGTFQQRAAFNITQFPKIQGSLLIRMGIVYPLMSYLTTKLGVPEDCTTDMHGIAINYHTWVAGYLAYLTEIQLGLSKYPMDWIGKGFKAAVGYLKNKIAGDKHHTV